MTFTLFWLFPVKLIEAYRRIHARLALYQKIEQEKLQNAVVFIQSVREEFSPLDLTRNPFDFQGTVLYVHDLGELNRLLFRKYPGRRFFRYDYDETKPPVLWEITPDERSRPAVNDSKGRVVSC